MNPTQSNTITVTMVMIIELVPIMKVEARRIVIRRKLVHTGIILLVTTSMNI